MDDLLTNLTVLSIEQATTLPFLTLRLASEGMRVIRVEHPQRGDPNRWVGPLALEEEGMNAYFFANNVGKQAITLNLQTNEGRAILYQLIADLPVDIFCTNQLPPSYERLGIGYERLRAIRQDLIWLGITGFGPESDEAAYDPMLQARSGLMGMTGETDGPPMLSGLPLADIGSGEHGYGQVMKALYTRASTGKGSRIDISMFQSVTSWMGNPLMLASSLGLEIERHGNTHRFFAPASAFETQDGYIYLAVGNDRQWQAITELPGFEKLARDQYRTNAGRIAGVEQLNNALAAIFCAWSADELVDTFRSVGVPVSRVNSVRDVVKDPYVCTKMVTAHDPRSGLQVHLPPPPTITPFLEAAGLQMSFPPRLGEHTEAILGDVLGFDAAHLADLKARGVI
jgi:crotonobetainyl-CoA:carnitine CoA-transferase CaiB-like acyl-CoA transferase